MAVESAQDEECIVGKLSLVDLAGSERTKKNLSETLRDRYPIIYHDMLLRLFFSVRPGPRTRVYA